MFKEQREPSLVDFSDEDLEPRDRPGYAPLDLELWDRLDALLRFLDARSADCFRLRFFEGVAYSQIGKRFGITKQRAQQVAQAAFQKLKRLAGGFGGRMERPGAEGRLAA